MIAIYNTKVKAVQTAFESDIKNQRTLAISKLKVLNNKTTAGPCKDYLKNVIELFEDNLDFLFWDSKKIDDEKDSLGNVPLVPKMVKGVLKQAKSPIKNQILDALGYKSLRNSFYPKYFNDIGIKACVYCNSQLTITANKKSAKFDVDHYHPKDDYPFLSISLFNLYPSCASCNRLKSTKKVKFELYTDEVSKTKLSDYKFKLESNAKAKYLTTKNKESIEFSFEEPIYPSGYKKFNDVFHIEGIYKTQLDLIEELIIKSQVYNENYLKSLKNSFGKLNLHPELFKRMLVGNYTEDRDIHKRPMSKLVMDIAKELELIK
mgnify:CR=1 FL=1